MKTDQISIDELRVKFDSNEAIFLLDVRSPEEHANYNIGGTLIPLSTLANHIDDIPRDLPIVVYCRSGCRSQTAIEYLQSQGFPNVYNLVGGILAWGQRTKTLV